MYPPISKATQAILMRQLKEICEDPTTGFSVGLQDESNCLKWNVCFQGDPDTIYDGIIMNAVLVFTKDFPFHPPYIYFTSPMWHPNIYPDGNVCISILNVSSAEDEPNTWRPMAASAVLKSVMSLLYYPEPDSPANVDAAIEFRADQDKYWKKVRAMLLKAMGT